MILRQPVTRCAITQVRFYKSNAVHDGMQAIETAICEIVNYGDDRTNLYKLRHEIRSKETTPTTNENSSIMPK
jgi:hypothetical protein